MAGAFPVSGNIEAKSFPFLVMDLHQHGATGSLKVDGPSYQKALYFRAGRVLFGSSNDPRDQLGAILIDAGKLTPEQLEEVNGKVGPGNPLAKVLADSGLVTQQELSDAAKSKVERILGDLLSYGEGSFEFEDGVLPKGAVDLKLHTERLVLGAVRGISDRSFVLGHLGSLEAVLTPTGALGSRAGELRTDTAGLVDQFDGRRSLKEAIGQTRLEEFDGAKIACALMFLGLIERSQPADAAPALFAPAQAADDEFDLGATARMALSGPGKTTGGLQFEDDGSAEGPSAPTTILPAPSETFLPTVPAPEPPPTVLMRPEPEPAAPAFVIPPPSAPAPFAPLPPTIATAPEPPAPAVPDVPVIPSTSAMPAPSPTRMVAQQPTTLLPRLDAEEPPPDQDEAAPAFPEIQPPSRSDFAALDALYNPKPAAPRAPNPSPLRRSPLPTFAPQPYRRSSSGVDLSRALIFLGLLLVLGGIGGGAWWLLIGSKGAPAPSPSTAPARPSPTLAPVVPSAVPSTPPPEGALGPAAAAPSPVGVVVPSVPPSAAPTPVPAPRPQPPAQPAGVRGNASASALLRAGRIPEAAHAALDAARAQRAGFTVQILVACSEETIHKALANSTGEALFVVPVTLKGRPCYRLCWGLYGSFEEASAADRQLPSYFRQGGATPRVVPVATILP